MCGELFTPRKPLTHTLTPKHGAKEQEMDQVRLTEGKQKPQRWMDALLRVNGPFKHKLGSMWRLNCFTEWVKLINWSIKTDYILHTPVTFRVFILTKTNTNQRLCCAAAQLLRRVCAQAHLFLAAAARSLCLLFLNQFPTWVGVSPVACASSRFLPGFGYGSCRYHSRSSPRVRSLKQCVFCSPSQMVRGNGNFFLTRYLSTGPSGRPRSFSASR